MQLIGLESFDAPGMAITAGFWIRRTKGTARNFFASLHRFMQSATSAEHLWLQDAAVGQY